MAVGAPDHAFDAFLDRLMRAESAGLSHAKNPRSSALGPFQFITSTFLAVMRQHFPDDIARLSEGQILALRTKHEVARRAAKAFSKDNMAYLIERGITPTFGHLRLAFLLGPEGAARVLKAPPDRAVAHVLEGGVIAANPFMRGMTAAGLIARATRDVSPKPGEAPRTIVAAAPPPPVLVPPVPVPVRPDAKPEAGPEVAAAPSVRMAEAGAEPSIALRPGETILPQTAGPLAPKAENERAAQAEIKLGVIVPAPRLAESRVPEAKAAESRTEESKAAESEVAESKVAEPEAAKETPAVQDKAAEPRVAKVEPPKAAPVPGRITARRLDRPAVINVTCDTRLASCRRWINQQVAKILVAEN